MLLPVETASGGETRSNLALISAARAATFKLANQREAADPHAPVLIRAAEPLDLAAARPIVDPALDLVAPLKGDQCTGIENEGGHASSSRSGRP